ncbi:MAG TPA: aldo/keto reductase [Gaiellaceae bacterium]|nr:aldo/keto reductase [Gaiellaceae bacterium]
MEQRELGSTGVRLTRIVLGCGNVGGVGSAPEFFGRGETEEEAFAIMDAAWAHGIRAFDTADAYGGGRSETAIGKWIAATGNRPTLTTKTYNPMTSGADHGLSRERVERQIASSLERLGLDHVDVYLAHAFDEETPLAQTVEAFESLVERGLIRAYGFSNIDGSQLQEALTLGAPAIVQNSYSLLERDDERDVIPICVEHGVAYEGFSPLAGGWLTGKYRRDAEPPAGSRMTQRPEPYERYRTPRVFDGLEALEDVARSRGVSTAALSLAWLLAQPHVTSVVAGPRRPAHLEPAVEALSLELDAGEIGELAGLFA